MKIKKCPYCGSSNKVSSTICDNCKRNIMSVRPTEEVEEQKADSSARNAAENASEDASKNVSENSSGNTSDGASSVVGMNAAGGSCVGGSAYLKRCPSCGMTWPYATAKCNSCGTSLAGQRPISAADVQKLVSDRNTQGVGNPNTGSTPVTAAQTEEKKILYTLRSEDGQFEIPLSDGDDIIIGRGGVGAEYLKEKSFVSGRHARVEVKNGTLLITHIGKTNPTLVNKKMIEPEKPYPLKAGELIELGAREGQGYIPNIGYFRVV